MANAIFVSLSESFPEIKHLPRGDHFESEALKNLTCGWWIINLDHASEVIFVFGVYDKKVMSVYRVVGKMNSKDWPTIKRWPKEDSHGSETRSYIPTNKVTLEEWGAPAQWQVDMYGPLRYGNVTVDRYGRLLSDPPTFDK